MFTTARVRYNPPIRLASNGGRLWPINQAMAVSDGSGWRAVSRSSFHINSDIRRVRHKLRPPRLSIRRRPTWTRLWGTSSRPSTTLRRWTQRPSRRWLQPRPIWKMQLKGRFHLTTPQPQLHHRGRSRRPREVAISLRMPISWTSRPMNSPTPKRAGHRHPRMRHLTIPLQPLLRRVTHRPLRASAAPRTAPAMAILAPELACRRRPM